MDETETPSHTRWECKYHVVMEPPRKPGRFIVSSLGLRAWWSDTGMKYAFIQEH